MLGPIRQGVLSGIPNEERFNELKKFLADFPDLILTEDIYCLAAEMYNKTRVNGLQGSHIDFLICAAAYKNNMQIFTFDKDFINFSPHLPIKLYKHYQ